MSRTDAILAALMAELEARRAEVDADDGLSSVTLIVRLDQRTRSPGMVVWRPESHRVVRADRAFA